MGGGRGRGCHSNDHIFLEVIIVNRHSWLFIDSLFSEFPELTDGQKAQWGSVILQALCVARKLEPLLELWKDCT